MKARLSKTTLTASILIMLAMATTQSCSSDEAEENTSSSSGGGDSSSSIGGSGTSSGGGGGSSSSTGDGDEFAYGELFDERDLQTYKTIKIGIHTWMAENLNFAAHGSVCYNGSEANCLKYGSLYDWSTAMGIDVGCNMSDLACEGKDEVVQPGHQGVCPDEWHIPSKDEWAGLVAAVGGNPGAGIKLKATTDWVSWNYNGTDEYGFTALPGGVHGYGLIGLDGENYSFDYLGQEGYWWTTSNPYDWFTASSVYYKMSYTGGNASELSGDRKDRLSIRCVKDVN